MRESHSSPSLAVRKGQSFIGNGRIGDYDYDASDEVLSDYQDDTLDPVAVGDNLQHSLRSLLRQKYKKEGQRRTSSADGVKITDFGVIDQQPPDMIDTPQDNFLTNKRLPVIDSPELGPSYSLNCFGFSSGLTPLKREDCIPASLPFHSSSQQSLGSSPLVKGVMWIQRERVFSRWKERFIILTQDYLQVYRRGTAQATEMGPFLSQVRLSDVQSLQLVDRRGYLTVQLGIMGEDNMLIRRAEKMREWYSLMEIMVQESKKRVMKMSEKVWEKKSVLNSETMEEWLSARARVAARYHYSPQVHREAFSIDRLDRKYNSPFTDGLPRSRAPLNKVHTRSQSADRRIGQKVRRPISAEISIRGAGNLVMSEDSGNSSLNNSTVDRDRDRDNIELWVNDH